VSYGKLFLIPNTLGGERLGALFPSDTRQTVGHIRHFCVEEIKSARRLLRRLDAAFPIDDSRFIQMNKRSGEQDTMEALSILLKGSDVGVISEAGCPGIADPGATIVAMAHLHNIHVVPMVGPSSILLALMSSGFSGQAFTFHGYLPKERKKRIKKLIFMENDTRRTGTSHLFMDTPFRNQHVLEDLLSELGDNTELCIASGLTTHQEKCKTKRVADWRLHAYDLRKVPAIFIIGQSQ
jgi:16S rRNA (cytidine1402-2'-O)-methyltransferase